MTVYALIKRLKKESHFLIKDLIGFLNFLKTDLANFKSCKSALLEQFFNS